MDISPAMAGAFFTFAVGLIAMLRPQATGKFVGIEPDNINGRVQLRTIGGFFIVLGMALIIANNSIAYRVIGASWTGSALVRITTSILEKQITGLTVIIFGGELLIATLFFIAT